MIVVMAINFYMSRVVLDVLGVIDYGIYNLVATIVVVFSFLKSSFSDATQRFINYTIWNCGSELFGYYECEKGADYAAAVQAGSPVVDRWNDYMKDVMVMEMDPVTGAQPRLTQVFLME